MDAEAVVEFLLKQAQWTASRSSGPGGQHRDKASTRAELTLDVDAFEGLPADIAAVLERKLRLPLRIAIQDDRSLTRNQEIATRRLSELVSAALAPPPPPRRPTRPTRGARESRLASKVRRGCTKRLRQAPDDGD
jgi:ribosome-associated protein